MRKPQRSLLRAGAIVVVPLLLLAGALLFAPVAPQWMPAAARSLAFDTRLLMGRPLLNLSSFAHAVRHHRRLVFDRDGRQVAIQSQGLTLIGTLYGDASGDARSRPAILLLHGSTPKGRKLGFYRVLARLLADRGYLVMTVDQRGFGDSDDPPSVRTAQSFDFVSDAHSVVSYLRGLESVDPQRVYLIGHSFGADVAASAVAQGLAVEKLILIGPGRALIERGGHVGAPQLEYFKRREMRYMRLNDTIPTSVFFAYRTTLSLENHRTYFGSDAHVPVLFVDGELEALADREWLAEFVKGVSGGKDYVTLSAADHYANVANLESLIVYDEEAVTKLVDAVTRYLQERPPVGSQPLAGNEVSPVGPRYLARSSAGFSEMR